MGHALFALQDRMKFEARNSKFKTNPKTKIEMTKIKRGRGIDLRFEHWIIASWNLVRIWCFGFRISPHPLSFVPHHLRGLLPIPLLIVAGLSVVRGEDRIVIQKPGDVAKIIVTGTIEDYTGRELRIALSNMTVKTFAARDIAEVETVQLESHQQGLKAWRAGEIETAREQFAAALQAEKRTWVRRELLALLTRTDLRLGAVADAGNRYVLLVESDPTTAHFFLAPLAWEEGTATAAVVEEVPNWARRRPAAAQLLAASWQLSEAGRRSAAEGVLKTLQRDEDARVRFWATAQLWRVATRQEGLTRGEVELWHRQWEAAPAELRAGPAMALGQAYLRLQDHRMAAACFLWPATVSPHDHHLAARGVYGAALALSRLGEHEEARTLCKELLARFGQTPSARDAQVLLKKLSAAG